jgi:uncharacterized protein YndB with AHSA1/START domain
VKRQVRLERTFRASIEDVWDLWTTRDGIESWWGPDGFRVEVRSLDLRPRGELRYAMIATGADQVAFLKREGMPIVNENKLIYTEVAPLRRLAWTHDADFIPGVQPYKVDHLVELQATPQGVRMVLTFDAMHDQIWTDRATMGWEQELGKLDKVIAA